MNLGESFPRDIVEGCHYGGKRTDLATVPESLILKYYCYEEVWKGLYKSVLWRIAKP